MQIAVCCEPKPLSTAQSHSQEFRTPFYHQPASKREQRVQGEMHFAGEALKWRVWDLGRASRSRRLHAGLAGLLRHSQPKSPQGSAAGFAAAGSAAPLADFCFQFVHVNLSKALTFQWSSPRHPACRDKTLAVPQGDLSFCFPPRKLWKLRPALPGSLFPAQAASKPCV